MSIQEKDGFTDCLFLRQAKLINLKFFRGSNDLIEESDFKSEICAAENRKLQGAVKSVSPPKCKKGFVDLRKLVAEL